MHEARQATSVITMIARHNHLLADYTCSSPTKSICTGLIARIVNGTIGTAEPSTDAITTDTKAAAIINCVTRESTCTGRCDCFLWRTTQLISLLWKMHTSRNTLTKGNLPEVGFTYSTTSFFYCSSSTWTTSTAGGCLTLGGAAGSTSI